MVRLTQMLLAAALGWFPVTAAAQTLPASQPNFLTVVREEVKVGRAPDHERVEAGWPAAYEKAKSPYYYLALVSTTGRSEAWYVVPYDSHKAMGDAMRRESDDSVLAAELKRLQRADADLLTNVTTIQLRARKDLSLGAYPDLNKMRFTQVSTFRVRPGHDMGFDATVRAYTAAAKRVAPTMTFRVYEVIAGIPGPTYMVFTSAESFADFDRADDAGLATIKAMTPEEGKVAQQFLREGLLNSETQRFRVDPVMSYVPRETRATDPAFWSPKRPVPAKTTTSPQ